MDANVSVCDTTTRHNRWQWTNEWTEEKLAIVCTGKKVSKKLCESKSTPFNRLNIFSGVPLVCSNALTDVVVFFLVVALARFLINLAALFRFLSFRYQIDAVHVHSAHIRNSVRSTNGHEAQNWSGRTPHAKQTMTCECLRSRTNVCVYHPTFGYRK